GSADDAGNFAVFSWSGSPSDAPVRSLTPLGVDGWNGSYEAAVGVDSGDDGQTIRVIQDDGTVPLYPDGTAAQDLPSPELKAFIAHDYVISHAPTETEPPTDSNAETDSAGNADANVNANANAEASSNAE
ncbi:MAG: hypothetical protein ACTJHU_08990, partial [Mycetocola sp.]